MKSSDLPPRVILPNSLSGLDGQIYWGLSYWGQRWRIYLCSVLSSVVCIYDLRLNTTQDVQLWLHKAITQIPFRTFFLTSCFDYHAVWDCFSLLGIVLLQIMTTSLCFRHFKVSHAIDKWRKKHASFVIQSWATYYRTMYMHTHIRLQTKPPL